MLSSVSTSEKAIKVFVPANGKISLIKEEVRRALAFLNNCPYCMAKGKPSENLTDKKSRCAVKAAHALSQGEVSVDEVFEDLKSAFTDKEISELAAYICFISACQESGAFLDLQPSCSIL